MLVITGRKKEVLNLGGDKVSPQLIEDAVAAFKGIREAGAFSVPNDVGVEEVWSFIVHGVALDKEALHKHCRERLSQTHVPVRFISVPSLPRNANGKLERRRLAAMAQELRGAGLRCGRIPQQPALKNGVGTMTCVGLVRTVEVTCGGC